MRIGVLVAACGLAGCQGETPAAWEDPTADDDWSALIDSGDADAVWTAEAVGAAIDAALAAGLPTAQPALDDFRALLAHGDAACPGETVGEGFAVVGACTSAEGYAFSGAAGLSVTDTRTWTEEGAWSGDYTLITAPADFRIARPDGVALSAGGTLRIQQSNDGREHHWTSEVSGTWVDPAAETGWLAAGVSGSLTLDGSEPVEGASRAFVTGDLTLGGASVLFEEVSLAPDGCPDQLWDGALAVRHPAGRWYRLVLDGRCGSCGEVADDAGEALGRACVDPAPLFHAAAAARAG